MANDINSKVASQLLDLNRNLDKLTSEVKKNTQATKEGLSGQETKPAENDDLKSIANSLKGLDGLKDITDGIKSLDLNKITEKLSSIPQSIDKIIGGINLKPGDIVKNFIEPKKSGFGLQNILGAFADGGVAKIPGNYLVGEKGPEVVKLPAGSAVIPLDSKELIEGLSEIPEISKSLKSKEVNIYGEKENPGLVLGGSEDIKNRISLFKLSGKYEDALEDQESLAKEKQNPEILKKLEKQNDIIQKIIDYSQKKIGDELTQIDKEYNDFYKKNIPNGFTKTDLQSFNKIWDSLLNGLPDGSINDLSVAKGRLLATKMLLNEKKSQPQVEKSEGTPASLIDNKTKNKEEYKKQQAVEKSVVTNAPAELLKSKEPQINTEQNKGISVDQALLSKTGAIAEKETAKPGLKEYGESLIIGQANKLISKVIPGFQESGILSKAAKISSGVPGAENKKNISALSIPTPAAKPPDLSKDLKGLTSEISGLVKSNVEGVKSGIKEKVSGLGEKISGKVSGGSKQNVSEGDINSKNLNDGIEQIKSLLSRIAVSLEGPLEVTPLDSPFRPNSRKV